MNGYPGDVTAILLTPRESGVTWTATRVPGEGGRTWGGWGR